MILHRILPLFLFLPLLAVPQQRASVTEAVIEDFSDLLTLPDTGINDYSGNMGAVNKHAAAPAGALLFGRDSGRPAMTFRWDFSGQSDLENYTGAFFSLFGLTDTLVSYDGKTPQTATFAEHSLNLDQVDGALNEPGGARRYLRIGLSLDYQGAGPLDLRLELRDSAGGGRFTRIRLQPSTGRQNLLWDFRTTYRALAPDLNVAQAKVFSLVVERSNAGDGIRNPDAGTLVVDRIWFVPDRAESEPETDAALLDLAGRRSCQYFLDWSSRKLESFGVPQDRSSFADLLSVGGIGFALPCYAIAAERGWIPRATAAARTAAVLRLISNPALFCADPVGCVGYRGWLYHFLGPDGRRKQNFDYPATTGVREDRNTVEVSTIDTTLALAGALAAQSYFTGDTADERDIRTLAQRFYDNVDWNFMLEPQSKRFYYGWKPKEDRDDTTAEFLWPDADGKGHYSSYQRQPQAIDYYTDEGFLMTLLSLGATKQAVPAEVHCVPTRHAQGGLVTTWPGSLFTYFFTRAFLATEQFNLRPCPDERPVNWLENSRRAFQLAIAGSPADAWGISAAEGPSDRYLAYGLPTLAVDAKPPQDGTVTYYGMLSAASFGADLRSSVVRALRAAWQRGHWHHRFGLPDAFNADVLKAFPAAAAASAEAENGTGGGDVMQRSNASGKATVLLRSGRSRTVSVSVASPGTYRVTVRTSNDNYGALESVAVLLDGLPLGSFEPPDTGDFGFGWDVFADTVLARTVDLTAGAHALRFDVTGGDGYGAEIDRVRLEPVAEAGPRAWVNRARFSIDEGPAALHLENARSGLIWTLVGGNPNVVRALNRLAPAASVSAASGRAGLAPESLVSSYGTEMPVQNVTLKVLDSAGVLRNAVPLFNNSSQANWVAPAGVAAGEATITIRGGDTSPVTGTAMFGRLAPGLFSASASGQGVAAANLVRVNGAIQTVQPVAAWDTAGARWVPAPIAFGNEAEQLYLVLYGTGLRGISQISGAAVHIDGLAVPVSYCGVQPEYLGLDQVNAGPLPRSLAGRGTVQVTLSADGQQANSVEVAFQ